MLYQFYQIKSKKSNIKEDGSQQISLCCKGEPSINFFLWFQPEANIIHIQFLFHEKVVEWFPSKGIIISVTNRFNGGSSGLGVQKGARSLQHSADSDILVEAKAILSSSQFPEPYGGIINKHLA